jgi:cysteine desulfurase / selenocysteine lyase
MTARRYGQHPLGWNPLSLHTVLRLWYARPAVRSLVLPGQTVITERGRGGGSDTEREPTPDGRMLGSAEKNEYFALVERTRRRFAQLINADADEVALTKNVSESLNTVAAGLPWQAGDNVVLCPELEHPNNVYCWLNLRRRGVEVRMVSPRGERMPIDAMVSRIDARTRVGTASTVTFAPGFRTEIDRGGRACRERGVCFMFDAAQSCGVLSTDVVASQIDGLPVSTQKGLLGLYGPGFLSRRRAWAE